MGTADRWMCQRCRRRFDEKREKCPDCAPYGIIIADYSEGQTQVEDHT